MTYSYTIRPVEELSKQGLYLEGAGGNDIAYSGYTELTVQLGGEEGAEAVNVPFLVTNTRYKIPLLGSNAMDGLLEGDKWETKLRRLVSFGLEEADVIVLMSILDRWMESATVASVTVQEEVVPANSSMVICCQVQPMGALEEKPVMFQPSDKWQAENTSLILYTAVVNKQEVTNNIVTINVRNNSDQDFYFNGGDWIGALQEVEMMEESEIRCTDFATATAEELMEVNKTLVQQSPVLIDMESDHWQHNTSPAGSNTTPKRW
jgi:hypothetical protein